MTEKQKSTTKRFPYKKVMGVIFAFLLLMMIAMMLSSGYLIWRQQKLQSLRLDQLQNSIQKLSSQQQNLVQHSQIVDQKPTGIATQGSQSAEQIALLQTSYLLKLANFSLKISYDPISALMLLDTAKSQLLLLNQPNLIPLIQRINQDSAALRSVAASSLPEVLMQLNAIESKIPQLTLTVKPASVTTSTVKPANTESNWRAKLKLAWQSLKQVIVVRNNTVQHDTLLLSQDKRYFDLHLQLLLMQARWACLYRNSTLYHASLMQAIKWVNSYYVVDNSDTKLMLVQLDTLQKIDIVPALPNLNNTELLTERLYSSHMRDL